jgi:hypothetical protein
MYAVVSRHHQRHRRRRLLVATLLLVGCDVRDEEARRGTGIPWLTPAVERMAGPSQRALPATAGEGRGVDYVDGYAAGSRRAADAGLPMLLVFRATWCRWSQELVAETLADPRLASMSGKFVAVNVDADRDAAACRSFGVRVFPTVIVLDRDRRESFRASGAAARAGLAPAVESALEAEPRRVAGQPAAPLR